MIINKLAWPDPIRRDPIRRPIRTTLFDRETESGAKMDKYSDLLVKAIKAIVRTFQKRTAVGLQSGRDFVIPDKQEQATGASDFELITWLVIKSGKN